MPRIDVVGDTVRLRPGWVMLSFALSLYLGMPAIFGVIGIVTLAHGLAQGALAYTGVGLGLVLVGAAGGVFLRHMHFWDETVEATPTELRLRRSGKILHRIDRDRLGATSFAIGGEMGSTGKHYLKVFDRDGGKLGEWPLSFGYDELQTEPFYVASGIPDVTLLRKLYQERKRSEPH